jgi:superfamily I DNA/RNA helicase
MRPSGRAGADLKDEDYTILSTIHSAKGQEWRTVRILNVVDGCIPSHRATGTSEEIAEERRPQSSHCLARAFGQMRAGQNAFKGQYIPGVEMPFCQAVKRLAETAPAPVTVSQQDRNIRV